MSIFNIAFNTAFNTEQLAAFPYIFNTAFNYPEFNTIPSGIPPVPTPIIGGHSRRIISRERELRREEEEKKRDIYLGLLGELA